MAKKSTTVIYNLQEEMITEIFVRLPVKALLICKSVCKPWLSIMSNPHFFKSHLHHAIIASQNYPTLLTLEDGRPHVQAFPLIQQSIDWEDDLFISDDYGEDVPEHQRHRELVNEALLDINGQDLSNSPVHVVGLVKPRIFLHSHHVISSYNGIICLANIGFNEVYLWNPSIRKCKKIPAPPRHTSMFVNFKLGFGYDSISDDYKVVRFVYYHKTDEAMIVQVYSSNADRWRAFQEPTLKNWKIYKHTNIVVNGFMYFDGGSELISFNLNKEIFGLVPFPKFVKKKRSDVLDFNGSVGMVFESVPGIDLWTLDSCSSQMSWTKKFSIVADLETQIRLSSYLGAGQFYGRKFLGGYYFLYDILYDYEKRETKYCRLGDQSVLRHLKYTESLISLDGFKPVE